VHIKSTEEAVSIRAAIIREIWNTDTLPANVPVEVTDGLPRSEPVNIATSQVLTRTMDFGMKNHAHFYMVKQFRAVPIRLP
jgi:hypothetical protein